MSIRRGLPFDLTGEAEPAAGAGAPAMALTGWDPKAWRVADDWKPVVSRFLASSAARQLEYFVQRRLAAGAVVYPPQPFYALELTPLSAVRVVILGQDPYHGPGQAQGLAFSVAPGVRVPPSLRNIFKEIGREAAAAGGMPVSTRHGSLVRWAEQGVLLLNTCLTVEQGQPASHARQGWEMLTDDVIKTVAMNETPVVFMLWGAHAQGRQGLLSGGGVPGPQGPRHLVLTANHPSPLSALRPPQPFMGCGHFGRANAFLEQSGGAPIAW